jgi:fermentation-respiration switch protein FrsA (DUF1100 family)
MSSFHQVRGHLNCLRQATAYFRLLADHMVALHEFAKAARMKKVLTISDGQHNDTYEKGGDYYYESVAQFLRDVRRGE